MRTPGGGSRLPSMLAPQVRSETFEARRRGQLPIAQRPTVAALTEPDTERKTATIIFTDVERSIDLVSSIELEEWWSLICELVERMCECVDQYGGWVGNFTGDGIVAVFEDDGDGKRHARRACDAALAMRDALSASQREPMPERELALSVRIGINSGEVLTGTIGGRHARYYTASGYAVSVAKRIEGLAMPGRVYVSQETAALVGSYELHDLGALAVKGIASPMGVFELIGRAARARGRTRAIDRRRGPRPLTPCQ